MKYVIKTKKEMEYVAAGKIREKCSDTRILARPDGFLGLVIVEECDEDLLKEIPEIERIIPVYAECKSKPEEIANNAEKVAKNLDFETFAVKTVRRGKHEFTSIDVDRIVGGRIKNLGKDVDLEKPEKIFFIEIVNETAYIGVLDGRDIKKKYGEGKTNIFKLLEKICIVQMPYLNTGAKEIGKRIGRAVQSFEIKELIVSPVGKIRGGDLLNFLKGVLTGINTRYEVQKKIYPRNVRKVSVSVQDMYQVFLDKTERRKSLVIITDPLGEQISKIKDNLKKDLFRKEEVVIFIGAREGIPKGLFRKADYVIDLSPYITFATEQGVTASVISLIGVYEENSFK